MPAIYDEPTQSPPTGEPPNRKANSLDTDQANSKRVSLGPPRTPYQALRRSKRIAFLLDGSGSMIDTMPAMIDWFHRALGKLRADQRITAIIFRRGQAVEVGQSGLHPATAKHKGQIKRWIPNHPSRVRAQGRSGIKKALTLALSYEVNTLYLLADDDFASDDSEHQTKPIVGQLNQALADRDITVHTVQFLHNDPDHVLQTLAGRFGGTYQFVRPDPPKPIDHADRLSDLTNIVAP